MRSTIKLFLHEFDQRAEAGLWVDERNRRAPAPWARLLVDDAGAVLLHVPQHLSAVVHAVPHVMNALTTLLEVLGERRRFRHRHEQLDIAVGDLDERLFDTVAGDGLSMGDGRAEHVLVPGD